MVLVCNTSVNGRKMIAERLARHSFVLVSFNFQVTCVMQNTKLRSHTCGTWWAVTACLWVDRLASQLNCCGFCASLRPMCKRGHMFNTRTRDTRSTRRLQKTKSTVFLKILPSVTPLCVLFTKLEFPSHTHTYYTCAL